MENNQNNVPPGKNKSSVKEDKYNTILAGLIPGNNTEMLIPKLKYNPESGFSVPFGLLTMLDQPQSGESVLKYNPDSGFSAPEELLAQLNLQKSIPVIDITSTNEYTPDEKTSLLRSFHIYEEGIFLGMIIGITSKEEVIKIMDEYSTNKFDLNMAGSALFYDDISVNFYFDQADILSELDFGNTFRGATSKGLRIGDLLEKAIEIYGAPRMKTSIGAIWDNMKIFSENFLITGIKIRK
jgi:hypothetical protein